MHTAMSQRPSTWQRSRITAFRIKLLDSWDWRSVILPYLRPPAGSNEGYRGSCPLQPVLRRAVVVEAGPLYMVPE